jgi:hypothetical protein
MIGSESNDFTPFGPLKPYEDPGSASILDLGNNNEGILTGLRSSG